MKSEGGEIATLKSTSEKSTEIKTWEEEGLESKGVQARHDMS
jgi:hypothetical protein